MNLKTEIRRRGERNSEPLKVGGSVWREKERLREEERGREAGRQEFFGFLDKRGRKEGGQPKYKAQTSTPNFQIFSFFFSILRPTTIFPLLFPPFG